MMIGIRTVYILPPRFVWTAVKLLFAILVIAVTAYTINGFLILTERTTAHHAHANHTPRSSSDTHASDAR